MDNQRFAGLRAFETRKVVFGSERRIVVTHSQSLHDKQSQGFDQTLAKARRQLSELAARLARGKTRKPKDKVEAEIAHILEPRWLSRVISTTLTGDTPAELRLTWRTKPAARAALEEEIFGKRILFSDKDKPLASIADIVADYRSQEDAEGDFRQMKDPKVVSFSPMFHWTDHKIRVHVFYCVLALMAARLMVREADRAGTGPQRSGTTRHPGRHPRDRAALPRRTGTSPSPADAHRDQPHPTAPLRPVRPRHLRPHPAVSTPPAPSRGLGPPRPTPTPTRPSLLPRPPAVVCPHALGWKNHRPMLLGYQVGGQTSTGAHPDPRKRWRCMYIDEIDHIPAAETQLPGRPPTTTTPHTHSTPTIESRSPSPPTRNTAVRSYTARTQKPPSTRDYAASQR